MKIAKVSCFPFFKFMLWLDSSNWSGQGLEHTFNSLYFVQINSIRLAVDKMGVEESGIYQMGVDEMGSR